MEETLTLRSNDCANAENDSDVTAAIRDKTKLNYRILYWRREIVWKWLIQFKQRFSPLTTADESFLFFSLLNGIDVKGEGREAENEATLFYP